MRLLIAGAALAGSLLCSRVSLAQNADPFFYGDEAALAAGSVVASGRDSGSIWYNPAGLGGLERGLVNASASTFGVRLRNVPGALNLRFGTRTRRYDLPAMDIISVPNALVFATAVGNRVAVALGVLTTQRDVRSSLAEGEEERYTSLAGAPRLVAARADVQLAVSKYHIGGALGTELSKKLRVGGSYYVTYMSSSYRAQSGVTIRDEADLRAFEIRTLRLTQASFGMTGSLGAQYALTPAVTLGATIRLPELATSQSSDGGVVQVASVSGASTPVSEVYRGNFGTGKPNTEYSIVAPTRLLLGLAYALGPPQSYVEIGADFSHGLPAVQTTYPQRPVGNARIGVRYMLSPSWIVGGGVFTDRATNRGIYGPLAGGKIDWYGASAGVVKRTPLSLAEKPAPEALVLITTLSVRAGVGTGTEATLIHDYALDGAVPRYSTVTYFELMPYLSSSVLF